MIDELTLPAKTREPALKRIRKPKKIRSRCVIANVSRPETETGRDPDYPPIPPNVKPCRDTLPASERTDTPGRLPGRCARKRHNRSWAQRTGIRQFVPPCRLARPWRLWARYGPERFASLPDDAPGNGSGSRACLTRMVNAPGNAPRGLVGARA